MKILALDTASSSCSVALKVDEHCAQREVMSAKYHSSTLLGLVRELLDNAGMTLRGLDLVAVDIGPGSFTGLRIGIGVAQGLAYGAGLPVKGIVSLAALAHEYSEGPVISTLDARMDQLYWGIYDQGREIAAPGVDSPENLSSVLSEKTWAVPAMVTGNGWTAHAHRLPESLSHYPVRHSGRLYPQAAQVAALAEDPATGRGDSPLQITARYVRNRVAEKSARNRT